jgi:hypothetical protein
MDYVRISEKQTQNTILFSLGSTRSTLSLKMRILYWIENTQLPECLRGFCEVLPLRAGN